MEEKKIEYTRKYRYIGFIRYLLKNNEEIRNLFMEKTNPWNKDEIVIFKEDTMNNQSLKDYYFILGIIRNDELVLQEQVHLSSDDEYIIRFMMMLKDINEKSTDDCILHHLLITEESEDIHSRQYFLEEKECVKIKMINQDTKERKEFYVDNIFRSYNLNYLNEKNIKDDFDHLMYLLKENKLFDEKNDFYKKIENLHKEYLNSQDYLKDLEYEETKEKHHESN